LVDQVARLADQVNELEGAGATKIFSEKVSGVDTDRPQLKLALSYLREGDCFIVTKPDRLARSAPDLIRIVDELTRRGVVVRVLSMGLDTSDPNGTLILSVLAMVVQFQRDVMLERQRVGIRAARDAGLYRGRSPTAKIQTDVVMRMKEEGKGRSEIMSATKISRSSYFRITKASREGKKIDLMPTGCT
jgi:DNA invertase Pin-like site-specific DNA recombinase